MENIYKIKIKSTPDPMGLYPSERRYSASIVLGLSVVHMCLALTAILMACLTLTTSQENNFKETENVVTVTNFTEITTDSDKFDDVIYKDDPTPDISQEIRDLQKENSTSSVVLTESFVKTRKEVIKQSIEQAGISKLSLPCCILVLGGLAAGLTGLLAWKRWYIDHNIKWFFFTSSFAIFTSVVSLVITSVRMLTVYRAIAFSSTITGENSPNLRYVLTLNIFICCVLEFIWSILSSKVAYRGMRNTYPDDIILSKSRGKIEVNTVHKGNKKTKAKPPDILNHFQAPGKFAKYFPKKENGNLPKAESNLEYQERVRKFLAAEIENESSK